MKIGTCENIGCFLKAPNTIINSSKRCTAKDHGSPFKWRYFCGKLYLGSPCVSISALVLRTSRFSGSLIDGLSLSSMRQTNWRPVYGTVSGNGDLHCAAEVCDLSPFHENVLLRAFVVCTQAIICDDSVPTAI
jgi:hypothetical protein